MNDILDPKSTWNDKYRNLWHRAVVYHSQYGEDGLIEAIFEICKPQNKWCVEVGAADGVTISNTRKLILDGWKAVLIEEVEETLKDGNLFSGYKKIVENYKDNSDVYPVHKKVEVDNLDIILAEYPVPKDLDFMSIDIDSYDADVWQNLKNYEPNLLTIECNEVIIDLNHVYYSVGDPKNAASVGYLNKIAEKKGYDFICATRCNAFYIKPEFGKPLRRASCPETYL